MFLLLILLPSLFAQNKINIETQTKGTLSGTRVVGGSPRFSTINSPTSNLPVIGIGDTPSSVNYLQISGAIAGSSIGLSAVGASTDIGITLTPKGSGKVTIPIGSLLITGGTGCIQNTGSAMSFTPCGGGGGSGDFNGPSSSVDSQLVLFNGTDGKHGKAATFSGLVATSSGVAFAATASDLPNHASRHQNGGADEVATATPGANAIVKAGSGGAIAVGWLPPVVGVTGTYGNASNSASITVDTYGRISAANSVAIQLNGNQITSGTVDDARLPTVLNGKTLDGITLIGDGSGVEYLKFTPGGTFSSCSGSERRIFWSNTYNDIAQCYGNTYYYLGNIKQYGVVNTDGNIPLWKNDANGQMTLSNGVGADSDVSPGNVILKSSVAGAATFRYLYSKDGIFINSGGTSGLDPALSIIKTSGQAGPLINISDHLGNLLFQVNNLGRVISPSGFQGNATSASALASAPSVCGGTSGYAKGIDASGNAQCSAIDLSTANVTSTLPLSKGGTGASSWTAGKCVRVNNLGTALEVAGTDCSAGGGGGISGPGTTTVNNLVRWNITNGTTVDNGLAYATAATGSTIVQRGAAGDGLFTFLGLTPTSDVHALTARRFSVGQTSRIASFQTESSVEISAIDALGNFTGKAATATALAATPSQCSGGQVATGIAASGNANCTTVTGAGNVVGPGSSAIGRVPLWNNGTGTLLSDSGLGTASTTATASTFVTRDSVGASVSYDKGGQVFNVKAYGANGAGGNDTTAIQAAIDACQNGIGGTVYFPQGNYGINASLTMGNGFASGSVAITSTKAQCSIRGTGGGSEATNASSLIKWIGSASPTYMLVLLGPIIGMGGISDIGFDGAGSALGIDAIQVSFTHYQNVTITNTGSGYGFRTRVIGSNDYFACYNTFTNMRVKPAVGGAGSGLLVDGTVGGTIGTSCNNTFIGGYFNRDGSGSGAATYGAMIKGADNNRFFGVHFSWAGANTRTGCGLGFEVYGTAAYPQLNSFFGISPDGICGTQPTGVPPNAFYGLMECSGSPSGSCNPYDLSTSNPPIVYHYDRSQKGVGTTEQVINGNANYYKTKDTGGSTFYSVDRVSGVSGNALQINAYNEILFANPSFVEGQWKIKPSNSTNPGACSANNEGWLWVDKGTTPSTLRLCMKNSASGYTWGTITVNGL